MDEKIPTLLLDKLNESLQFQKEKKRRIRYLIGKFLKPSETSC